MTTKKRRNPLEWLAKMMFWFIAVPFFGFLGYFTQIRPYFLSEHGEYWYGFVDGLVFALSALVLALYIASKIPRKRERKPAEEDRRIALCDETSRVSREGGLSYEFELDKGVNLKGEVVSNRPIDIYLVDAENFTNWEKDRVFNYELCSESALKASIDFIIPKEGKWYLLVEGNKRLSATVKTYLYVSGSD